MILQMVRSSIQALITPHTRSILTGSNPGCGTTGFPALKGTGYCSFLSTVSHVYLCISYSYPYSLGWDPVTGVGSPNYQAMRKALGLS